MPLFDKVDIRGLIIDQPDTTTKRYRLFMVEPLGHKGVVFEFPNNTILNVRQVTKAVRDHLVSRHTKVNFSTDMIKRLTLANNEANND